MKILYEMFMFSRIFDRGHVEVMSCVVLEIDNSTSTKNIMC